VTDILWITVTHMELMWKHYGLKKNVQLIKAEEHNK